MTEYEEYLKKVNSRVSALEKLITSQKPEGLDSLTSIDDRIDTTNQLQLEVVKLLSEIKIILKFPAEKENPSEIVSQKKVVSTAGTAEQLPYVEIELDKAVVIKALGANTGTIYIGNSKPEAEDTNIAFPLLAGEAVEYKIKELSKLWVNASVSGEGLAWTVERRKGSV